MIVQCERCNLEYDDLDHLTYCPHNWFPKAKSFEEICEINDQAEGLAPGTTKKAIESIIH